MAEDSRASVFISYSHADRSWLDRLLVHLKPVTRDFAITVWSDRELKAGSRWREQIRSAIDDCKVAILLVSADFFASDFIHENELPPLLVAAEQKGKLILPVIFGPCLFLRRQDLSAFFAVNDPARPLTSMPVGESEAVLRDVAERVLDIKEIPERKRIVDIEVREDFLDPQIWPELAKLGNWVLDPQQKQIIGSGMNAYLLSRGEFGAQAFIVDAAVAMTPLPMTGRAKELGMNAGIVLGYKHEKPNPRYVHVAFTGTKLFIERVGFNGGSVVRDYEHVTEPVTCPVEPGHVLRVQIGVREGRVSVHVDGRERISVRDQSGLEGRIGLRPWRSTLVCSHFVVDGPLNLEAAPSALPSTV